MKNEKKESIAEGTNLYMRGYTIDFLNRYIVPWIPILIGIGIAFLLSNILSARIAFTLGFFIAGFSGVIAFIRQEFVTGRYPLSGKWAMIVGLFTTIMFWGAALYILVFG